MQVRQGAWDRRRWVLRPASKTGAEGVRFLPVPLRRHGVADCTLPCHGRGTGSAPVGAVFAPSSNGRTSGSEPGSPGPNPGGAVRWDVGQSAGREPLKLEMQVRVLPSQWRLCARGVRATSDLAMIGSAGANPVARFSRPPVVQEQNGRLISARRRCDSFWADWFDAGTREDSVPPVRGTGSARCKSGVPEGA